MKCFLQRFTVVYSGLQRLAACNGGFKNEKIHKAVKLFNINPWWPDLQALSLAN